MREIRDIKARRRENLAALRERMGAAKVAQLTGMAPALLYQMSQGKGKQARNISDANARLIEKKCGLERGALDADQDETTPAHSDARREVSAPGMALLGDESELLAHYRNTDERGRETIMASAKSQNVMRPIKGAVTGKVRGAR